MMTKEQRERILKGELTTPEALEYLAWRNKAIELIGVEKVDKWETLIENLTDEGADDLKKILNVSEANDIDSEEILGTVLLHQQESSDDKKANE